ncbi:MAG: hypothetical protein U1C57_00625 [Candidatus Doudnabacteria bacterium]|nr:hypothetical protein [bacterium]MDZ4243593.1 hypothetical protein [Candidatus Doudnabacteria bacterium]
MKTYKFSWGVVLLIGIALWVFESLAKLLGLVLVVLSIISLFQNRDKVHVSVDANKKDESSF